MGFQILVSVFSKAYDLNIVCFDVPWSIRQCCMGNMLLINVSTVMLTLENACKNNLLPEYSFIDKIVLNDYFYYLRLLTRWHIFKCFWNSPLLIVFIDDVTSYIAVWAILSALVTTWHLRYYFIHCFFEFKFQTSTLVFWFVHRQ
jgi:hypothetical protein